MTDADIEEIARRMGAEIIAELPDGRVEPLLWLDGYKPQFAHVFLFRSPIELPAGTVISGIPSGSSIVLLPAPEN